MTSRGTVPQPVAEQVRKRRCRVLDRLGNRCSNEALSDLACLHHTREIAAEWEAVKADVTRQFPALRKALNGDAD